MIVVLLIQQQKIGNFLIEMKNESSREIGN